MFAIQTPSATALMTPARRDSPRRTATVSSVSWPRPKTRRVPSGIPTTSPEGVLTRAARAAGGGGGMTLLTAERGGGGGGRGRGRREWIRDQPGGGRRAVAGQECR